MQTFGYHGKKCLKYVINGSIFIMDVYGCFCYICLQFLPTSGEFCRRQLISLTMSFMIDSQIY